MDYPSSTENEHQLFQRGLLDGFVKFLIQKMNLGFAPLDFFI